MRTPTTKFLPPYHHHLEMMRASGQPMYVKVHVRAKAKREQLEVNSGGLEISVREPARQNLANLRACALVARHFKVPTTAVRILSGHHSPKKLLSVNIH